MSDTPRMDTACDYLRRMNERNVQYPTHDDSARFSVHGVQKLIMTGKELERDLASVTAERNGLLAALQLAYDDLAKIETVGSPASMSIATRVRVLLYETLKEVRGE